jgi:tetratricopeptide (TPR) repeat protein
MKTHHCIVFLLFLPGLFFHSNAAAQNIRGDTIYVDVNKVVAVSFPSSPDKAELLPKDSSLERLYEVNTLEKNSLSILALKGANNQYLEVTETKGGRKHLFILSYKEGSPARSIDLSTIKRIKERVAIVKRNVSNALNEADNLYRQAKNNMKDQALWEELRDRYAGLNKVVVDPKDVNLVKLRLEEIGKQLQVIILNKKYDQAIQEGRNYYTSKNYEEAIKAYKQALDYKPGDASAKKWIRFTDSTWAKVYIDSGDAAYKVRKYREAKTYYQTALNKMADYPSADYPSLQDKLNQVKKDADPLICKDEKKIGVEALNANDIEGARKACDSALSVCPEDPDIKSLLEKVKVEERKIEQDEKKESEYQDILATAKELADKASDVQGYDLAIKEYQRALSKIPGRKFPKKKMDELKIKLKEMTGAR